MSARHYQQIQDLRTERTARSEFRSHAKRLDIVKPEPVNFCADEYEEASDIVWLQRLVFCVAIAAVLWTVGVWVTP